MISAPSEMRLHQNISLHVHHEERGHDREEQHDADRESGLAAHREQEHHEDDRDCLTQVEHELAGGLGDRFGLEVDLANLDADWLVLFKFVKLPPNAFAKFHDVAALHGGDAQADGWLAVVPEQTPRRVLFAALQRRHVPEEKLAACLIRANYQSEHVFGRLELAFRIDRDVLVANAHTAAVGSDVFRLQLAVDLLFVNPELREPLPRDFKEDDFLLFAEELDFLDIRHQEHFAAQEIGVAAQFRLRVALAGNGQEDAVDVAKIVDHHRPPAHRRGQLRLDIGDLAAKFVPDLRDSVLIVPVLDNGGDHRPAARRLRFNPLELT